MIVHKRFSTRQIAVAGLLGGLTVVLGLSPVGGFIPVPTPAASATTMHIPTILAGILEGPVVGGIVGFIFGLFSFYRAFSQANPVAKMLFTDPLIAFVPRILIGVVAYYAYTLVSGEMSRKATAGAFGLTAGYTTFSALGHAKTLYDKAQSAGSPAGLLASTLGPLSAYPVFCYGLALIIGGFAAFGVLRVLTGSKSGPVAAALLGTATNTAGVLGLSVMRGYLTAPVAWGIAILQGIPEMLVAALLVVLIHRGVTRSRTHMTKTA